MTAKDKASEQIKKHLITIKRNNIITERHRMTKRGRTTPLRHKQP